MSRTIAAYQEHAVQYADAQRGTPHSLRNRARLFARLLGGRGRVLEIGSGSGRNAAVLEAAGSRVDRTDITPAFVELLQAKGHRARVLDPLTDQLGTGYDGVWAQACLLHVDRGDLAGVLFRLAAATRERGVLYLSLKEGDGQAWSTHGSVGSPRRFVYWREQPLREVLESSGWAVPRGIEREHGDKGEDWLVVFASALG